MKIQILILNLIFLTHTLGGQNSKLPDDLNFPTFSLVFIRILSFLIIVNSCFACVQKNNKTKERLVEQRMVAVKTQDEIISNSIEIRNDTINYSLKDSLRINYFWQIRASSNIDLCICKDSTIIYLGLGHSPDYVELVCEDIRFLEILFYKMFMEKIRFDKSINLRNRYSLRIPYTSIKTIEGFKEPLLGYGLVLEKIEEETQD